MTAQRVDRLIYKIEHGPFVSYDKAAPLNLELPKFRVKAKGDQVTFEMKCSCSTVVDARKEVDPFAKAWVLDVTFSKMRGWFDLKYENCEMTNLATGVSTSGVNIHVPTATISVDPNELEEFPMPPSDKWATPDVQSMFDRYVNSMNGREPLPGMAYFCVTVLKSNAGGSLKTVAEKLNVSVNILEKLQKLCSRKGGRVARKADARTDALSPDEEKWIKLALKSIIARLAEVEFDPAKAQPKITMRDI